MSITASIVANTAKIVAGSSVRWLGCQPETCQRVYFANHTSHLGCDRDLGVAAEIATLADPSGRGTETTGRRGQFGDSWGRRLTCC